MEESEKTEEKNIKNKKGISLSVVYTWMMMIAAAVFVMMMTSMFFLAATFSRLSNATNEHIDLERSVHELMDASDYLTENVQRFTVDGDRRFMDAYFDEAFENNRRQNAVKKLSEYSNSSAALAKLQKAMNASLKLMEQEYYAMKLVIEAKEYTDYPEILKEIRLNENDQKLSSDKKMRRATELMLNDDYYKQKEEIRKNQHESLTELENLTFNEEETALNDLHTQIIIVVIMIVIQTAAILFLIVLTSHLGIKPVLEAVERIKDDDPIPEIGANEFRYLAHTYNKMYSIYKGSLDRLNFKASHDELTGAYNRSGYELLISSVDMETTHMILFDLDNFKSINDTYGHETGDRVLIKLVKTLQNNFRSDDYICRIGGDEFVVFMVHTNQTQKQLIATKISNINKQLSDVEDGLPPISVSVGIVHGTDAGDNSKLFEKADEAMYRSKQGGKKTCTFYSE